MRTPMGRVDGRLRDRTTGWTEEGGRGERTGLIGPALSPVTWLARLAGTFPYDSALDLSPFWALIPLLQSALCIAASYLFHSLTVQVLGFSRFLYSAISWILSSSVFGLAILSFTQKENYKELMSSIASLEADISDLDIKAGSIRYSRRVVAVDMTVRFILNAVSVGLNFRSQADRRILTSRWIGFYVTQISINAVQLHIVALATYLADLFRCLSERVRGPETGGEPEREMGAATRLVETTERLERLFGKQALIVSGELFLCGTLDLFTLLIILRDGLRAFLVNPMPLLRITTRSYELWRLVSALHALSQQAKWLDAKMYTLILEEVTNGIANKENVMVYFTMKKNLTLSACGLFPIDFSLVHSIVAAVTNYLIILVQFGGDKISNPTTFDYKAASEIPQI